MKEMKCFFVNFMWSNGIYCANIVYADDYAKIAEAYSKYEWFHIRSIREGELSMAKRKGMPIIKL